MKNDTEEAKEEKPEAVDSYLVKVKYGEVVAIFSPFSNEGWSTRDGLAIKDDQITHWAEIPRVEE